MAELAWQFRPSDYINGLLEQTGLREQIDEGRRRSAAGQAAGLPARKPDIYTQLEDITSNYPPKEAAKKARELLESTALPAPDWPLAPRAGQGAPKVAEPAFVPNYPYQAAAGPAPQGATQEDVSRDLALLEQYGGPETEQMQQLMDQVEGFGPAVGQPKSTPSPGSAPVGGRPTAGGGAGASIQALVGGGGGIALPSGFPAYQGMPQGQGIMPQQGGEQQDGKSDFMDFLLAAGLAGLGGARDQWGRKDPMLNLSNALQAGLQSTEKKDEKAAAAQQQQLDNRMKLEAHRLKMEKGDLELRIKQLRYLAATAPNKRTSVKAARAAQQAEQQLGEVVKQEGQFVRIRDRLGRAGTNIDRKFELLEVQANPAHPDQQIAERLLEASGVDFGGGDDDILSDGGDDLNKALDESGL